MQVRIDPETGKPIFSEDDEDEEDAENLFLRLPDDPTPLIEILNASQGFLLLLMLKDHLKEVYGINDK